MYSYIYYMYSYIYYTVRPYSGITQKLLNVYAMRWSAENVLDIVSFFFHFIGYDL